MPLYSSAQSVSNVMYLFYDLHICFEIHLLRYEVIKCIFSVCGFRIGIFTTKGVCGKADSELKTSRQQIRPPSSNNANVFVCLHPSTSNFTRPIRRLRFRDSL